jgi:endonuclease/exonuclease/phosphatase family metal-dependent hydrolase
VKALHLIAIICHSILAMLTLIVIISVFIPPSFSPYFTLLSLFFPFLVFAHFLFLIYWIWKFKKYVWISVACLLMSWPGLTNFVQWNSSYFEQDEDNFVLLTYNIHHSNEIQQIKESVEWKESLKKWKAFIKSYPKIDVINIQENNKKKQMPLPGVEGFAYSHMCTGRGPLILSRHPIVNRGCIDFENSVNGAIYVDLKIEEFTFRVYNVHLQSSQVSHLTQPFLREDEMAKGENVKKIRQIFGLYLRSAEQRSKQLKKLLAHADESPYPVIIAGDLNEGPNSYVYRKLRSRYTDTFKEKGRGVSSTYAGNLPFLRIDHIFHDEHWETQHYQVCQLPFSDHYPVAASLSYRKPTSSR